MDQKAKQKTNEVDLSNEKNLQKELLTNKKCLLKPDITKVWCLREKLIIFGSDIITACVGCLMGLRRSYAASILYFLSERNFFSKYRRDKFYKSAQKRDATRSLPHYALQNRRINDREIDKAIAASRVSADLACLSYEEARRILSKELPTFKHGQKLQRLLSSFDTQLAERYVRAANVVYDSDCVDLKVTVVMPTFNRGTRITSSVISVLEQSHYNLELIIVDDGSTDNTHAELAQLSYDPRVRVLQQDHLGVSEARNTGLRNASGVYVFYLDSDNTWTSDYVKLMLSGMRSTGADCAYSACCIVDEAGNLIGFRGEPFDWNACISANYVDMNVFAHRRELFQRFGGFDVDLRRMVDWDLILRYTRFRAAEFFPFIGCMYLDNKTDKKRISLAEPKLYTRVVREKNKRGLSSASVALAKLQLRFAIKIEGQYINRYKIDNFHFAVAFSKALRRVGHEVRIDFSSEWYTHKAQNDDVVIVLRGVTAYAPQQGQLTLMWSISEPDQVPYDEYAAYNWLSCANQPNSGLFMIAEN